MALSPNKSAVALYGAEYAGNMLQIFDAANLGKDNLNVKKKNLGPIAFAWSKNAEYFIIGIRPYSEYGPPLNDSIMIFDKKFRQYKFSNLPNFGVFRTIDWSAVEPGNLKLLTDVDDQKDMPKGLRLMQNYPNPFNPSTMIEYTLPKTSKVSLGIYDVLGREVKTIVDERQTPGTHRYNVNLGDKSTGIYFYRLTSDDHQETKKMMMLK
jgi:hypothetical protein